MRILLDENLPRKLAQALVGEGHDVESVHTLRLAGVENGKLYDFACDSFDICFTRDRAFVSSFGQPTGSARLKLLRVTLRQKPQNEFVLDFVSALRDVGWERYESGDDWP